MPTSATGRTPPITDAAKDNDRGGQARKPQTKCAATWPLEELRLAHVEGEDHPPLPVVLCPDCHGGLELEVAVYGDEEPVSGDADAGGPP